MKFFLRLFLVFSSIASSKAMAYQLDCASSDASTVHHYSATIGGAYRNPLEYWVNQGETYTLQSPEFPRGEENNKLQIHASFDEASYVLLERRSEGDSISSFEISTFTQKVTVLKDQILIFDDYMICTKKRFTGLPRP